MTARTRSPRPGCARLFTDTASGSTTERPGLEDALNYARPGDTLVVWRLDRLGRSLRHLIDIIAALQARERRSPAPSWS